MDQCILIGDDWKNAHIAKVAVVIATRNRPELAQRAAESVLAQEFDDVVVVVVDNSDDPSTIEVNRHLQTLDSRIRVIVNRIRDGAAWTRNLGLWSVSREVQKVFFLDDDDMFATPEALSVLMRSFQLGRDVRMAYGIQLDVNSNGLLHQMWPCHKRRLTDLIIDDLKVQFPAHTVLWNADLARLLGGFSTSYDGDMEDIVFILRGLAMLGIDSQAVRFADEPIVKWRRGSEMDQTLHSIARRNLIQQRRVRAAIKQMILGLAGYPTCKAT